MDDGFAFCVNERNIDHLRMWLESFEVSKLATKYAMENGGNVENATPVEHGARLLNAIAVLTESFAETQQAMA